MRLCVDFLIPGPHVLSVRPAPQERKVRPIEKKIGKLQAYRFVRRCEAPSVHSDEDSSAPLLLRIILKRMWVCNIFHSYFISKFEYFRR